MSSAGVNRLRKKDSFKERTGLYVCVCVSNSQPEARAKPKPLSLVHHHVVWAYGESRCARAGPVRVCIRSRVCTPTIKVQRASSRHSLCLEPFPRGLVSAVTCVCSV